MNRSSITIWKWAIILSFLFTSGFFVLAWLNLLKNTGILTAYGLLLAAFLVAGGIATNLKFSGRKK